MANRKITELTAVASLPDEAVFTAVDSTRTLGDQNVKITKANLAADIGGGSGTLEQALLFACSDETSDLAVSTDLTTFPVPFDITLTDVRAFVATAPTGSSLICDIKKNGVSILATLITIDAGEKNSEDATTPPVISDASLSKDDEITVDITQIGSTVAGAGLKISLIYNVTITIT